MEIHKAEFLFSQTILGKAKIKNPNVLERTCYKCPACSNELSFSEIDFQRYNMNKISKYNDVFPKNRRKREKVLFGI